jgi:hypothetical protein
MSTSGEVASRLDSGVAEPITAIASIEGLDMVDAVDMIVAAFEAMEEAVLIARVEARVEAAVVVMRRACQRHPGAHASGGRGECGGECVSD